jgi:hypothetical protein
LFKIFKEKHLEKQVDRQAWINTLINSGYSNKVGSTAYLKDGVIENTVYKVENLSVLRTSQTVADGTASSAGVLVNKNGFYACAGSQTTANANVRILATGDAYFAGTITASAGEIGGWTIGATSLYSGTNIVLDSDSKAFYIKSSTFGNSGIQLEYNAGTPRAYIGDGANQYVNFDGTNLSWKGTNTELTAAGEFTSVLGYIGGWTISDTALYKGTDIVLDSSNEAIYINSSVYGDGGVQIEYNLGSPRVYIGDGVNQFVQFDGTNISWEGTNTSLTTAGVFTASDAIIEGRITALTGQIGGWEIDSTTLKSNNSSVKLDSTKSRVSIYAGNTEKVVMGYLEDLPKNDGTGNWSAGDYGFWAKDGDRLNIDGDVKYESGDWIVENDGSLLIKDGSDNTIIRLGTAAGEKGMFIYNTTGQKLAKYVSDMIMIGKDDSSLTYSVANGIELNGQMNINLNSNLYFTPGEDTLTIFDIAEFDNDVFSDESGKIIFDSGTEKIEVFMKLATPAFYIGGVAQLRSYTTAQINALTASEGQIAYNSTTHTFMGYNGSAWLHLGAFN